MANIDLGIKSQQSNWKQPVRKQVKGMLLYVGAFDAEKRKTQVKDIQ